MSDPRLVAALAAALHRYRGTCELWTISEAACPIDHRVDAAAMLGERGVFLPDGLGPVMVGMAKEIAALRDALEEITKTRPANWNWADSDEMDRAIRIARSALVAAKETQG